MADVVINFEGRDGTQNEFSVLSRRLRELNLDANRFTRTRKQQESDFARFQTAQLRQVARQRKANEREQIRSAKQVEREQIASQRNAFNHRLALIKAQRKAEQRAERARERALNDYVRSIRSFASNLALGLGFGAFNFGRIGFEAAIQFDTARNALTALTGSQEEANRRLERFQQLAKLPSLTLQSITRAAVQFEAVGTDARLAERAIAGLGNQLALFGQTDLNPLVRAFTQIQTATGVMQEEINQLRDALPGILGVIRQEFGTVDAEVIRDQGITPDEFIRRLVDALERVPRATVGAATTFQNFQLSLRGLGRALAELALPQLTIEIQKITAAIDDLSEQDFSDLKAQFDSITVSLSVIAQTLLRLNLPDLIQNLGLGITGLGTAKIGEILSRASSGAKNLNEETKELIENLSKTRQRGVLLGQTMRVLGRALAAVGAGLVVKDLIVASQQADDTRTSFERLKDAIIDVSGTRLVFGQRDLPELQIDAHRRLRQILEEINRAREEGDSKAVKSLLEQKDILTEFIRLQRARTPEGSPVSRANRISELERQRNELRQIISESEGLIQNAERLIPLREKLKGIEEEIANLYKLQNDIVAEVTVTTTVETEPISQEQINALAGFRRDAFRALREAQQEELNRLFGARDNQIQRRLELQRAAAARQTAIAEDQGRRAVEINRQSIATIREQVRQQHEEERREINKTQIAAINAIFERAQARREYLTPRPADRTPPGVIESLRPLDVPSTGTVSSRESTNLLSELSRIAQEQGKIIGDQIRENERQQRESLQRMEQNTRQHLQDQAQLFRSLTTNFIDATFALITGTDLTFGEVVREFLASSARIIAQYVLEVEIRKRLSDELRNRELANIAAVETARNAASVNSIFSAATSLAPLAIVPALFGGEFSNLFSGIRELFHNPAADQYALQSGYSAAASLDPGSATGRRNSDDFTDFFSRGFRRQLEEANLNTGTTEQVINVNLNLSDQSLEKIAVRTARLVEKGIIRRQ